MPRAIKFQVAVLPALKLIGRYSQAIKRAPRLSIIGKKLQIRLEFFTQLIELNLLYSLVSSKDYTPLL